MQADKPYSNVFTSSKGKEHNVKSISMQVEQSNNDKTFRVWLCCDCKAYFLWIRYYSHSVLYARFEKKGITSWWYPSVSLQPFMCTSWNLIGICIRSGRRVTNKNGCLLFLVFKFYPFDFLAHLSRRLRGSL